MKKFILAIFVILLSFNTFAVSPADLSDHVRKTYFFIAGFPDTATRDTLSPGANIGGMLGIVNDYLDTADSVLGQNSVASCDAIPTSGTLSGTVNAEGTDYAVSLALGNSVKLRPAGFPNEGTSYQKSVAISVNGTKEMTIEFDCSRKAGWFSFKETGSSQTINMFYDNESATQVYGDFFMLNTDSRTSISFRTQPDNTFSFISISAFQNVANDYRATRTVARGNWTTDITSVVFQEVDSKATFDAIAASAGATSTTVVENTADGDAKQTVGCIRDLVGSIGQTCGEVPLVENSSAPSLDSAGLWNLFWTASSTGLSSKILIP